MRRQVPSGLFLFLISLDVALRLLEKTAVAGSLVDAHATLAVGILKQPWWWLALALGPLQLWTWMRILARTELSLAYPLSSLSYPLTMVAAWRIFGEQLSWQVWLGALFITVGVAMVGSTTATASTPFPGVVHANSNPARPHRKPQRDPWRVRAYPRASHAGHGAICREPIDPAQAC